MLKTVSHKLHDNIEKDVMKLQAMNPSKDSDPAPKLANDMGVQQGPKNSDGKFSEKATGTLDHFAEPTSEESLSDERESGLS